MTRGDLTRTSLLILAILFTSAGVCRAQDTSEHHWLRRVASFVWSDDGQARPRVEASAIVPIVSFSDFDPLVARDEASGARVGTPRSRSSEAALGGRLAWRLTRRVGLEADVVRLGYYANSPLAVGPSGELAYTGGSKTMLTLGATGTTQHGRWRLLGEVAGGVTRFQGLPAILSDSSSAPADGHRLEAILIAPETAPAYAPTFVLGGGVACRVWSHIGVRADLDDAVIWYRPQPVELNAAYHRHNPRETFSLIWGF
jgi:hypothetical protein